LLHVSVPRGKSRRIDGGTLSEPNEATTAEPVAVVATTLDPTPEAGGKTPEAAPFWKRWLGKS
jgi:hypothetical protein